MALTKVELSSLKLNPFDMIGKQWMLISAGNEQKWNTMTASWGGLGVIWGAPTATAYIRESRYTKEFVDAGEYFTLSFLAEGHRDALNLLGSKSGRDIDKMQGGGLTPVFVEGQPSFEEAETVFVCKKRYAGDLAAKDFLDPAIDPKWYSTHDYHKMYLGEIVACYQNL